jgi:hypothetical protein
MNKIEVLRVIVATRNSEIMELREEIKLLKRKNNALLYICELVDDTMVSFKHYMEK